MKVQNFVLKNNLQVILIDTQAFPSLTALLLIGAGSRYENKKNNGIAHFFEHMVFKGSKKYPNAIKMSSSIESIGGEFNAFTSKDYTGYWVKAPTKHFDTVVDVLSDMIQHPLLKEKEIEREKGVIVEEINMYQDLPHKKVFDIYEKLLYGNNPLGMEIAGSKKTVLEFNRQMFTDYIKKLYQPKNTVLVIAGGLEKNKNYLKIIEEKFIDWTNGEKASFEKVKEKQNKSQISIFHKKTEQTHFMIGFRAFSLFDERKYSLGVLAAILGVGMSSRLFYEIRERRGLCYYISTGREHYHDVGSFYTQVGVGTDVNKLKKTIELILKEHKKVSQGKIKDKEIRRAKELLKGRLYLSLESSNNVALFYGRRQILQGKTISPENIVKKIDSVTKDELTSLASDLFHQDKLSLAVVGPVKEKDVFNSIEYSD